MKYMVISPYITGLPCDTMEQAESALYLLQCVGGFGQIVEVSEQTPDEDTAPEAVEKPKPRGRPRSTK